MNPREHCKIGFPNFDGIPCFFQPWGGPIQGQKKKVQHLLKVT